MVDSGRLWRRIFELGEIGRQEVGGVTRLSFTEEERAVKDRVASYMEQANLSVREDAVGNLVGRREGRDPDAPVVLVGSHLDSVYNGGGFDGPLGVLAGVEVAHTLEKAGVETDHPVEVVAFTDEEGARFSFGMIGSRALAGRLTPEDQTHEDENGISIADAMRGYGLNPERVGEAARPQGSVAAYVELHIEQGRILENEGLAVGVVTGIAAPVWRDFVLTGGTGHAGTTPMGLRRDPLAAAAEVMGIVEAEAAGTGTSVGTVGQLNLRPGGINIIPGRVLARPARHRRGGQGPRRGAHPGTGGGGLPQARGGHGDGATAEDGAGVLLGDGARRGRGGVPGDRGPPVRARKRRRTRRDAARGPMPDGYGLRRLPGRRQPQPRRVELQGRLRGRRRGPVPGDSRSCERSLTPRHPPPDDGCP